MYFGDFFKCRKPLKYSIIKRIYEKIAVIFYSFKYCLVAKSKFVFLSEIDLDMKAQLLLLLDENLYRAVILS